MWRWLVSIWQAWRNPVDVDFDSGFPDSDNWSDRIPLDAECPTTQPTDWGMP